MIKNYHDDVEMARYGRICAKHRAIREAKEALRDNFVRLGNTEIIEEINEYFDNIKKHVADLIEAINIDVE